VIKKRKGVSLIEVAMGLGIMSLVALGTTQLVNDQNQASRALNAAVQLETMRAATYDWVRANYQQLVANLPVGGAPVLIPVARNAPGAPIPPPVTIGTATFPSLQGGGFLPATTVDRNPYNHTHAVMVRQTALGTIEALVVQRGGQPVRDTDLGRIVARVGQSGGARFENNANPAMANMVQGNAGSWVADSATWTASGVTPQVSRAAASVSFGNASMLSDFLNRFDIGIPEANTMRTAMNMGGNDINNAATVRANQAVLQYGGNACASNAAGCSFWISDDGRFSDFNDGWIRFQGSYAGGGLTIQGAGGNLWVEQDATVQRNISAGQDLSVGRDVGIGRNLGVANDIWSGRDIGATRNIWATGNLWIGGSGSVTGSLGASQVWTNYLNSSGNADIGGAMNIGQSAAIWGAGGLFVAANITANGNIATPGIIQGGYISSLGTVDAGVDANAQRHVHAWGGYVYGAQGVATGLNVNVGAGCAIEGMIGRNASDGGMLWCQGGVWRSATAAFNIGPVESFHFVGNVFRTNPYSSTILVVLTEGRLEPVTGNGVPGRIWRSCMLSAYVNGVYIGQSHNGQDGVWNWGDCSLTFAVPPGGWWYASSEYLGYSGLGRVTIMR
jgi:hypothetical protein